MKNSVKITMLGFEWLAPVLLSVYLFGCASTRPDSTPDIEGRDFPPIRLSGIESRELSLSVLNQRKINQDSGNSGEIENLLKNKITQMLSAGGIKVVESPAKQTFQILVLDCNNQEPNSACVKIQTEVKTTKLNFGTTISGQFGITNRTRTGIAFGDPTEAYTLALQNLPDQLEEHLATLLKAQAKR